MVGGDCLPTDAAAPQPPVVVGCAPPAAGGVASEAPGAHEPPALLGSVDRWPLANVHLSDSWGEAVRGNRRTPACPRTVPPTRGPHAAAPRPDAPRSRWCRRPGALRRTVPGDLSGGNRMAGEPRGAPRWPRRPGVPTPLPRFYLPRPLAGRTRRPLPDAAPRRGRRGRGACRLIDTWLILPVVICLSQRLSHACLSISNLYCETANGSLNQLSFI